MKSLQNIDFILEHRSVLDVILLFEQWTLWELVGHVVLGFALGLTVAHQIWRRKVVCEAPEIEEPAHREDEIEWVDQREAEVKISPPRKTERPAARGIFAAPVPVAGQETSEQIYIAYLMDVSNSLTDQQFQLCQSELTSALQELPEEALYQVIFFSGAAWFGHQRMIEGGQQGEPIVIADGDLREEWTYSFGGYNYALGNHRLPSTPWRQASRENIRSSIGDIERVEKSYGTTWHLPFMMAINLEPAPTRIHFLTDGKTAHQDLVSEGIIEMVKRRNPATKVYTNVLQIEEAAAPLRRIATATGGAYQLIN